MVLYSLQSTVVCIIKAVSRDSCFSPMIRLFTEGGPHSQRLSCNFANEKQKWLS